MFWALKPADSAGRQQGSGRQQDSGSQQDSGEAAGHREPAWQQGADRTNGIEDGRKTD